MGIKGFGRVALVAAVFTGTLVGQQPILRAQDLPGEESSTCSAGEMESRRTKKTKTVLNEDCTYTVTFGQNLHYEAAPGRWEAVDLAFRQDGSEFVADRNSTTVRISGGRVDVTDSETGRGIRWLVPNAPAVRGHRATFMARGLEWEYAVTDTGVKLGALVTAPRGSKSYEFPYQLLGGDGDLAIDADGNLQGSGFFIPRPVAFGSNDQSYPAGRWKLLSGHRVGFDFDDAELPADAYPYILDPSTVMHEANSSDDGAVTKSGYSYPPSGCSGWQDSISTMYVMRTRNLDGQYYTNNAFMRWHTGSLPDNATVSMVDLRMVVQHKASSDGRSLVADWHYDWPIDCSDHSDIAKSNALPGVPISSLQTMAVSEFPLSWSTTTGVSLTGYTGLRAHVSGEQPAGSNVAQIYEFGNWDAMPEPRLAITYATPNSPPSASSASDSPDPVTAGATTTFSVGWSDPNAGDSVRALICKTNSVTSAGGCANGAWATGGYSTTSPSTAALTTSSSMVGTNTYYAFACDNSGACSNGLAGTFTVVAPNSPPVVTFNVTPTSGDRSTVFNANFNGTYDPNNDPISYRIDWGDGWINNSQNANHRYQNAGTYTVTGRACDGFGACSTSSRTVTVAFSNRAPSANLTVNPTEGDLQTTFQASLSGSDADGDSVSFKIDWGDGTVTQSREGEHRYAASGNYVVRGTVSDQYGLYSTDTETVRVCELRAEGVCAQAASTVEDTVERCYESGTCPEDPIGEVIRDEVAELIGPLLRLVQKPPLTPMNRVLVVDANVMQAYAKSDPDYEDDCSTEGATQTCDESGREERFAQRLFALSQKPLSATGDGMGNRAPDVILLQESRWGDADNIAGYLSSRFGKTYLVAQGRRNPVVTDNAGEADWCRTHEPDRELADCMADITIKNDTAIIYNSNGVRPLESTVVESKYPPSEKCQINVDTDLDGENDCAAAKWKRHYVQGFVEVDASGEPTKYQIGVASVHFVTKGHFQLETTFDKRSQIWVNRLTDKMASFFPVRYDAFAIGGDLNNHRCGTKRDPDDPTTETNALFRGDHPVGLNCEEENWYKDLTGAYSDTVLDQHADDDGTGDRIVGQYMDGNRWRTKRIDYVFSRLAIIVGASHDLTCGLPGSCRDEENAQRYSDHRLVWSLLRPRP